MSWFTKAIIFLVALEIWPGITLTAAAAAGIYLLVSKEEA